jgi:hypothetical protein
MAGNITDYLENAILNHVTGFATYTKPTNTFAALYLVAPTDSTAGTEVTLANNYSRQQITWGAAASGSISNSADIRFPGTGGTFASADWGQIVAIGILDAASSGNLLWYGPLSASVTVHTGESFTISAGGLTLSLD